MSLIKVKATENDSVGVTAADDNSVELSVKQFGGAFLVSGANKIQLGEETGSPIYTASEQGVITLPAYPVVDQEFDNESENAQSGKAVAEAIGVLDKTDTEVAGQFVSKVSETDGIIDVTRKSFDQIYDLTSTNAQSGKAVHEAFTKEYITSGRLQGSSIGTGVTIEGNENIATGSYSHAEGINTKALSDNQHVQGKYNIEDTENTYAHIVGNGESDTERSNAHTLDWEGNAWYAGKVSQAKEPIQKNDLATVNYVNEQDSHNEKVKGLLKEITTPAMFTDSDGDAIRNLKVTGASYQNGIPTPTAPIAIQNTGNELKVVSCGKNLIPYPYYTTTKTVNGVTFTDNGDGTITANGTATANANFLCASISSIIILQGTYTLSSGVVNDSGESSYGLVLGYKTDNSSRQVQYTLNGKKKITLEQKALCDFIIVVRQGQTVSNLVFKPQLEIGTVATSYESYSSNTYSIVLADTNGTNHTMRKYDVVQKHDDGKWYFEQNSNIISFDGTETMYQYEQTDIWYSNIGSSITDGLSNRFKNNKIESVLQLSENECTIRSNGYIYFRYNVANTNTFKSQLAQWNTSGNPLIVEYQTATTTSYELSAKTSLALENIYSRKGVCNIFFSNEVIPSGSFEYVQELKESIVDVGNKYFYEFTKNSLTTPITITDSYGGKLINKIVIGKSKQTQIANTNLLPYPYVNTTNIVNGITFTDNGDGTINVNGTATANAVFYLKTTGKSLSNDVTYTISNDTALPTGLVFALNYYNSQQSMKQGYVLSSGSKTVTFTWTSEKSDYQKDGFYLVVLSGNTINNFTVKPQLQIGSAATAFVQPTSGMGLPSPSYPSDIENTGDVLKLTSCGKNLFDTDYALANPITTNYSQVYFVFEHGKTYTISVISNIAVTNNTWLEVSPVYSVAGTNRIARLFLNKTGQLSTTVTIPNDNVVYRLCVVSQGTPNLQQYQNFFNGTYISNIQIEKDSIATSYEPYHGNTYNISLIDTNNTSHIMRQFDEVKKHSDGKWYFEQNSKIYSFVGTENIYESTSFNGYYVNLDIKSSTQPETGFSNRFKWGGADSTLCLKGVTNVLRMYQFKTLYPTVADFKTQLTTWNTSGTPLLVLYQMANPTSYELSESTSALLDSITIKKGNANIYFTNWVVPTMTADYPLDLKLYMDNKFAELQAQIIGG